MPFSPPSGASAAQSASSSVDALPVDYLDRVSIFETLRSYGGKIFRWSGHWARLLESCLGAGLPLNADEAAVRKWIEAGLKESGHPDALLRISVHRLDDVSSGEFVVMIRPFKAYPAALYENGVKLKTAVMRRQSAKAQDPQIKASQFMTGVLAVIDESGEAAHELIFMGQGDAGVSEGTTSNIFIVKGKKLWTPPVSSGILRGVTRRFVIELAEKRGIAVTETPLSRHEVYTADECFITNTSSEILPVVALDARTIGSGKPGEVTKSRAKDFKQKAGESLEN
jgi:branched-chain amino acid aminotransferase